MALIQKNIIRSRAARPGNHVEIRIYGPSPLFDRFLCGTVVSCHQQGDEVTLEIRPKRAQGVTVVRLPATRTITQFI